MSTRLFHHYKAILVLDIDGTLANNDHRAHHVDREEGDDRPKDWVSFLSPSLVALDTVIEGAVPAVRHFERLGFHVVFLTGRDEKLREVTTAWIERHIGIKASTDELFMRPDGCLDKAPAFKNAQLDIFKGSAPDALFVVVDDEEHLWCNHALMLRAPGCWSSLFQPAKDDSHLSAWRK